MGVDRSYVAQNTAQRERLRALVARCNDEMLARPLEAGWTVAAVLGHLAFWDQRTLVLIDRWQKAGVAAVPSDVRAEDIDWINDAAKPLMLALPPRRMAELTLAIADAVDRRVESLPEAFVERNAAAGRPLNLLRAEHRREHLDEIDAALKR